MPPWNLISRKKMRSVQAKFDNMLFLLKFHFCLFFASYSSNHSIFFSLSLLIPRIRIDCIYKGERYASGAEWSDPDDPCASFKCVAGVVTESNMQCYTPCNNPLTPRKGQCCSTCLGKFIFFLSSFHLKHRNNAHTNMCFISHLI